MSKPLQEAVACSELSDDLESFASSVPELTGWVLPAPEECAQLDAAKNLNSSQLEAFKYLVKRSLSVVQGPPGLLFFFKKSVFSLLLMLYSGTGKTYFGAWVVALLLKHQKNKKKFLPGPILVTCESNCAVDRFLETLVNIGETRETTFAFSKSKEKKGSFFF
jgi:hypothetical protein